MKINEGYAKDHGCWWGIEKETSTGLPFGGYIHGAFFSFLFSLTLFLYLYRPTISWSLLPKQAFFVYLEFYPVETYVFMGSMVILTALPSFFVALSLLNLQGLSYTTITVQPTYFPVFPQFSPLVSQFSSPLPPLSIIASACRAVNDVSWLTDSAWRSSLMDTPGSEICGFSHT